MILWVDRVAFLLASPLLEFPWWFSGKESTCNAGDMGWIPGLGRSPEGVHGNPLKFSCLGNPMHRGAWRATVHRVAKSWTWLSYWVCTYLHSLMMENEQVGCYRLGSTGTTGAAQFFHVVLPSMAWYCQGTVLEMQRQNLQGLWQSKLRNTHWHLWYTVLLNICLA